MKTVSIIGFGRFGKTLYRLLKDDFKVVLFDKSKIDTKELGLTKKTLVTSDLTTVYQSEVIFFSVPISSFEKVIYEHKKYFKPENLLVDVLSVKKHAKNVFDKHLKGKGVRALLTHPMFGPDSSKNGFEGLPIVMDKYTSDIKSFHFWKNFFKNKGLGVVQMSVEKHDKLAAESQAIAHFIGRGLKGINFKKTSIDTKGAKLLSLLIEMTNNDSMELFSDLQRYNPFTKVSRAKFIKSLIEIDAKLSKE